MKKSRLKDYVAGILIGASSILSQPTHTAVAQETKQEQSIDDLTQSEVDSLMLRESVDDILKEEYSSGRIQKVVYDSSSGKTNFREIVYQDNIPKEQRKPVIMLVTDGDGLGGPRKDRYCAGKGDAVILKHLVNKYNQFKVVVYDPSIAPDFVQLSEGKCKFGKELKNEGTTADPSLIIYGNKGNEFEKIYLFKGGPIEPGFNASLFEVKCTLEKEIKRLNL